MRQAIDNCPALWFIDDYSPIFLQTDASDYGIGAYLYQVVTNSDDTTSERPVGFISKSIANEHTSWDTPMKEGFAIFYALKKWEYLLRGRQFTILTDHQNLTRLRADHFDTNKMVKRWFMAFQEYDIIDWQFVKGADNIVADNFSRLCINQEKEKEKLPTRSSKLLSLLCTPYVNTLSGRPVCTLKKQLRHNTRLSKQTLPPPVNTQHLFELTGYEVPQDKWDLIAKIHNAMEGHHGVERTLAKLEKQNQHWTSMLKHVKHFIKLCPCCQKMNQLKPVIHATPFTTQP